MTMTHEQYTRAVDEGHWPASPRVPLPESFKNEAGEIQNLLLRPSRSIAAIRSVRGALRANHYHKTDWHYTYVASGKVLYFERPVGSKGLPRPEVFLPGEVFFTPPNVEHVMLFAEESLIVTIAKNSRDHESHESDVVRVSFVTPEMAREFLG